jgi:hypothetical protein
MADDAARDSPESSHQEFMRGESKSPPSKKANSHPHHNGAKRATKHAKQLFNQGIPPNIQQEVKVLIGLVQQKYLQTSKKQIEDKFHD